MNLELTMAQKFKLKVLTDQAQNLTKQQAIDYLVELIRQDMVKSNAMKSMIKDVI